MRDMAANCGSSGLVIGNQLLLLGSFCLADLDAATNAGFLVMGRWAGFTVIAPPRIVLKDRAGFVRSQ